MQLCHAVLCSRSVQFCYNCSSSGLKCLFLYLAQSTFAVARSLVYPGFNGIGSDCLILCSHDESFRFFLLIAILQPVPSDLTICFPICVVEILAMQCLFLPSFLAFECTLCAAADVFTKVPYFLLYCLSDLKESSSPNLFAEGIVYQCHSVGVEYDGQS